MTLPIRSILALTILVVVLAACSTAVGAPQSPVQAPTQPAAPADPTAEPSVEPVEPSAPEAPADEERQVDGILTVAEGMAYSGPGGSIQEALDNGPTGDEIPTLVNGVLFRDTDGKIYLASGVSDTDAPTFDGPMLLVQNMDSDGPEFDITNADLLGLEEANGIVFRQNAVILGFLELP